MPSNMMEKPVDMFGKCELRNYKAMIVIADN